MVEIDQGSQVGWSGDDGVAVLWYGVRVAGRRAAVDLGVLEGIGGNVFDDGSIQIQRLPWFKIAYRP